MLIDKQKFEGAIGRDREGRDWRTQSRQAVINGHEVEGVKGDRSEPR